MHVVSTHFGKRWFANGNMTRYCDVTNSIYPVTMTTIRYGSTLEFIRGGIQSSKSPRASPDLCTPLFRAVNTLRRQGSTIPFKIHHVLFSRAPASETYFTFFSLKCHAKLFSRHSSVLLLLRNVVRDSDNFFVSLFSLEVKLLWRNAFCMWQGFGQLVLLCLYFYIPQY